MACCALGNCTQMPEFILWDYDYQTYCENHSYPSPERQIYRLKNCSVEYLKLFIWEKYQRITHGISSIIENSLKGLEAKKKEIEASIMLVESMKEEYVMVFNKIFESTPDNSKDMIDATINNFVYIEKNIPLKPLTELEEIKSELEKLKERSLEISKYRYQFMRPEDENMPSLSKTMVEATMCLKSLVPEDFINQKVVYLNLKNNLELWKVKTRENKQYYMKRLEYTNEKSKGVLLDEIELLNTHKISRVFAQVISKFDDGKFLGYYKKVYEVKLSKLLKSKTFTEKEIWDFVELIKLFVNLCSGKIKNYILEPKCIGCYDGLFIIQDIKYFSPELIEKYISPEFKNYHQGISASSMVIYSAGIIILEMLKIDINGLNRVDFYDVLTDKVSGTRGISDELKNLILQMVHFDVSKRVNRETIYSFKPN